MKNVILLLSTSILYLNGFSQEIFHVLHVRGNIKIDTAKAYLKIGDEFKGNPNFRFSSEDDISILLSNFRGRLVLSPLRQERIPNGEFFYFLKENLLPIKDYTGTRGEIANYTYLFFENSKLLNSKKIKISKRLNSKASHYFLKLTSNKGDVMERRLPIDAKGFLEIDNSVIDISNRSAKTIEGCQIYYYDGIDNKSRNIKMMVFIPKQISEIKEEIKVYRNYLVKKGISEEETSNLISDYLVTIYGIDVLDLL